MNINPDSVVFSDILIDIFGSPTIEFEQGKIWEKIEIINEQTFVFRMSLMNTSSLMSIVVLKQNRFWGHAREQEFCPHFPKFFKVSSLLRLSADEIKKQIIFGFGKSYLVARVLSFAEMFALAEEKAKELQRTRQ